MRSHSRLAERVDLLRPIQLLQTTERNLQRARQNVRIGVRLQDKLPQTGICLGKIAFVMQSQVLIQSISIRILCAGGQARHYARKYYARHNQPSKYVIRGVSHVFTPSEFD
jgi:hypothetical protein